MTDVVLTYIKIVINAVRDSWSEVLFETRFNYPRLIREYLGEPEASEIVEGETDVMSILCNVLENEFFIYLYLVRLIVLKLSKSGCYYIGMMVLLFAVYAYRLYSSDKDEMYKDSSLQ